MMGARFDSVVSAATVLLGAGIGTLGSLMNPFATVIAADAAGIAFTDGIVVRAIILVLGWALCVFYVMRYARAVRNDPTKSLVYDKAEENKRFFLGNKGEEDLEFTPKRKIILAIFTLAFGIMIYGVSVSGWWMAELSALFLGASIIIGLVGRLSEEELTSNFIDGARIYLGLL